MKQKAQVYWITGLSGAGKTTIARFLQNYFLNKNDSTIHLDGDILRKILGGNFGYSNEERFQLAMTYSRLCEEISSQGINVICSTISMFDKCREWNRLNIENYIEIYIRVPKNILIKRDQKKLYSSTIKRKIKNVMGLDIPFEEPKKPDIIIDNDDSFEMREICNKLIREIQCLKNSNL